MSDSSYVAKIKRLEKMVSYAKTLGDFCDEFYNIEEPYTPHGECPFWNGTSCVLQITHPSNWDNLIIVQNDTIEESS